jgi:hypothetical protein
VLGEGAKKLTPSVLSDLKRDWTKQFHDWQSRDLSKVTSPTSTPTGSIRRSAVTTPRSACWC